MLVLRDVPDVAGDIAGKPGEHGLRALDRAARAPASMVLGGHAAMAAALFMSDGHDQPVALVLVLAALAAWAVALYGLAGGEGSAGHAGAMGEAAEPARALRLVWGVALGSAVLAFVRPPGAYLAAPLGAFHAMAGAVAVLLASYAADVLGLARVSPPVARARRGLLFVLAFAIGVWVLRASPDPKIDLFPMHQQAARAMLAGRSIYEPGAIATAATYVNLTTTIDEYTYLPLGAVLTTAAYAVTHDARFAELVCQVTGAALLWAAARRATARWGPGNAWPDLLAACLLFHPRGTFVLEQAWVEPMALPFLGGFVVAVLARRPWVASVMLGLLIAVKQHLVLYVPFLALLPGVGVAGAAIAGATALATIAPFALRSPHGFVRGVLGLQVGGPFRGDALSIPGELSSAGVLTPTWVGFAAALVPLAWLPRLPRRLAPLLLASCLAFGLFYVLGRQAFCNYYYLLDVTALFAAAALFAPASISEA